MKHVFRFCRNLCAVLVMLSLISVASAYDLTFSSLVRNGAVEIADTSWPANWYRSASGTSWATDAYVSANHALKLSDASSTAIYDWRSKGMQVIAGKKYMLEWDWKHTNVSNQFRIYVNYYDGPVNSNGDVSGNYVGQNVYWTGSGSLSSFVHNMELVTAANGAQSAEVKIMSGSTNADTGDLWIDNIVLRPAPNLALNADGEYADGAAVDSWYASSTDASWATDRYASATHSLKVTDASTAGSAYWQSRAIPVFNYNTQVSWKWAYENVVGSGMKVEVRWWTDMASTGYVTGSNLGSSSYRTATGTNTTFATNTYWLTPPAGAKYADIVLWGPSDASGTIWMDDVELIQKDPIGYSTIATYVPAAKEARRFTVIDKNTCGTAGALVMIHTLEGLVAQTRPEIYLKYNSVNDDQVWLDDMRDSYGVKYLEKLDVRWYLHNYKDHLINNRYILCNATTDSLNIACSMSGRYGAVVVDQSQESLALAEGLVKFKDMTHPYGTSTYGPDWMSQQSCLDTYKQEFRDNLTLEFSEEMQSLRDMSSFASIYTYYKNDDGVLRGYVHDNFLPDYGMNAGWWSLFGEGHSREQSSQANVEILPWGQARNMTALSSLVDRNIPLQQHTRVDPTVDPSKHLVAFIASDGGVARITLFGLMNNLSWWASPHRGTVPMNFGMPAGLCELAPGAVQWFYDHASNGTAKDYFAAGASGFGYFCPSDWGGSLTTVAQMTNHAMALSDLTIQQLIDLPDTSQPINVEKLSPFTAQSNIQQIVYLAGPKYESYAGAARWNNGKPIVSIKHTLWPSSDSDPGKSAATVLAALNNTTENPVNLNSHKGYSIVLVEWWDFSMNDVDYIRDNLISSRKIVTLDELFGVMKKAMDTAPWTFADDEESWSGERNTLSGGTGAYNWDSSGALKLEAWDNGSTNTDWNGRFWKYMPIPTGKTTLSFKVKARTSTSDANLSVKIKDQNGNVTNLQNNTLISSTTYATKSYNISAYAGTWVTIYIQCDDDTDNSSSLLIDDVALP